MAYIVAAPPPRCDEGARCPGYRSGWASLGNRIIYLAGGERVGIYCGHCAPRVLARIKDEDAAH